MVNSKTSKAQAKAQMKLPVLDLEAKKVGELELPKHIVEVVRPDIIKKVVVALQLSRKQPYGASEEAGKRHSAKLYRRRRVFRTAYGYGISRVPRKILSRRGSQFYWQGAFAPGTVGGRRAHPPKPEKDCEKKINKKERRKAIRSALIACFDKELVSKRHKIPEEYPFVIVDDLESITKTTQARKVLEKLGFKEEINRLKKKKVRAGKGKNRGRKYRKKTGPLIITSKKTQLEKAVSNLGFDVVDVKSLNPELLAPGAEPGRAIIITKSAVELIEKEGLFV